MTYKLANCIIYHFLAGYNVLHFTFYSGVVIHGERQTNLTLLLHTGLTNLTPVIMRKSIFFIGMSNLLAMSSMTSSVSVISSVTPATRTQLRQLYISSSSIYRGSPKFFFCKVDIWSFRGVLDFGHS